MKDRPPPLHAPIVDHVFTDILVQSVNTTHPFVVHEEVIRLIDFYTSIMIFHISHCRFQGIYFPYIVDATVTTMLSSQRTNVTLYFASTTTSKDPCESFSI